MKISIEKLLKSDRIPTLPEVALRVVELAQDPDPDFAELTRVIKADPAICARVMRTVNSALFGLRHRVSSIDAAVPVLGANMVRTLVLSFALAGHGRPSEKMRPHFQRQWRSSVVQAVAAETLAMDLPGVDESVWFLGGLLQDIGKLALLSELPSEYSDLIQKSTNELDLLEVEQRELGCTHVDVSVHLCLRWRLDNFLVDAISKHHSAVVKFDKIPAEADTMMLMPNALRCAAQCAMYIDALRYHEEAHRDHLMLALRDGFHMDEEELDEWLTDADMRTNEVSALFAIDVGRCQPIEAILAKAQRTLSQIALQNQLDSIDTPQLDPFSR